MLVPAVFHTLKWRMHESPTASVSPPSSPSPQGPFRRAVTRVRALVIRIRRAGVPHEETVLIPSVVAYATFSVIGESGWRPWFPSTVLLIVSMLCGAWLGLSWCGYPVIRICLRAVYIGVLTLLLYMLFHDDPITKPEAVQFVALTASSVGLIFVIGFVYGGLLRDLVLKRFPSERYRERYLARKAWWAYIWRLARDKEDRSSASDWDYVVSSLVKSCMDVKGLSVIFGLMSAMLFAIWQFSKWLGSGMGG